MDGEFLFFYFNLTKQSFLASMFFNPKGDDGSGVLILQYLIQNL